MNLRKLGFEPDDKKDKGDVHRFIQIKRMYAQKPRDFFEGLIFDLKEFYEINFDRDFESYILGYFKFVIPSAIKEYKRFFEFSSPDFKPYDFFYERLMIVYDLDMDLAMRINSDLDFIIASIFDKISYVTWSDFENILKNNKDIGRYFCSVDTSL